MDSTWFDDLLRSLASGLSRRATNAALANGFVGAGFLASLDDETEARKKRKRKKKNKKRKCKGGTKKCGKTCIPKAECCGNCPGDKVCQEGDCVCAAGAPFERPGDVCLGGQACGESGDCGPDQTCVDGNCFCSNPNDVACGALCCNSDTDVCEIGETTDTCLDTGGWHMPRKQFLQRPHLLRLRERRRAF